MKKSLFEQIGGTYEQQGDYMIPYLALPPQEKQIIGIWGQRHARYLRQYRKILYTNLLTNGKLHSYLAELNKQAEDMFFQLVKHMTDVEGVNEQLKAENQIEWVRRMNNIRNMAAEIVYTEVIYNI